MEVRGRGRAPGSGDRIGPAMDSASTTHSTATPAATAQVDREMP